MTESRGGEVGTNLGIRAVLLGMLAMLAWPVVPAGAAAVTLPIDVAGVSWRWESIGLTEGGFGVDDALLFIPYHDDAYDGFWNLTVDDAVYEPGAAGDSTSTAWGTTVSGAAVTLSGLTVTERLSAFCVSPTLRVLVTLTNPTGESITAVVKFAGNYGSDDDTTIEATSSGDTSYTVADRWLITSDDNDGDPINTVVWYGPGGPVATPTAASIVDDDVDATFQVTVPAGATRHLMFFSQLDSSVSAAVSAATDFDSNAALGAAGYLSGLTAEELTATLNWASPSASTPAIECPRCGAQPSGTFPLPLSVAGAEWLWMDFTADGGDGEGFVVTDAVLNSNSTDDAYDDFWALDVDGTTYGPSDSVEVAGSAGSYTRVTASAVEIAGLEVRQEFVACCSDPTLAVLVTLHNPGSGDISVPLTVTGNVGSDSDTTVDATSSGDTAFDATDRWLVTDGDADDPVNTFMFHGPGAPQSTPAAASIVADDISVTFQAAVPAGATRRYLFFSRMSETVPQATEGIAYLDGLAAGGSCGLSPQDLVGVVNWEPLLGENIPVLGQAGLALLALALAAAGVFVSRRS